MRKVVIFGGGLLIVSAIGIALMIPGSDQIQAEEAQKAQADQPAKIQAEEQQPQQAQADQPPGPVTDCFESRQPAMDGKSYTSVTRVEDVVPEYGYPNIKCSDVTKGVLWWGDPYDGTIPMGDMPLIDDETRGDYAKEEAVVKPREPKLLNFNMHPTQHCALCHNGKIVPFPKDKKPRLLKAHQDIVANSLQLMHGRAQFWCLDCHNPTNRNTLIDHGGQEIGFNQPQKLCGKCHGEVYADWRMGIHGKRIGMWTPGGKKRWWVCTECHNPHLVQVNRFQPIKPEPAPILPKGMKTASHETNHAHGSHKEASSGVPTNPADH